MALIDVTDFDDLPYKIPHQEEYPEFEAFIEAREEELLKEILGIDLYNEFMAALDDSGEELADKWVELRDGAEYEFASVTNEYKGLVDLLKPAIYSKWVSLLHRRFTTSGVIVNTGQQNTTVVNPIYEIVTYWNEFAKKVGHVACQRNTFYGFMIANEDDYDGWEFSCPEIINQFDL